MLTINKMFNLIVSEMSKKYGFNNPQQDRLQTAEISRLTELIVEFDRLPIALATAEDPARQKQYIKYLTDLSMKLPAPANNQAVEALSKQTIPADSNVNLKEFAIFKLIAWCLQQAVDAKINIQTIKEALSSIQTEIPISIWSFRTKALATHLNKSIAQFNEFFAQCQQVRIQDATAFVRNTLIQQVLRDSTNRLSVFHPELPEWINQKSDKIQKMAVLKQEIDKDHKKLDFLKLLLVQLNRAITNRLKSIYLDYIITTINAEVNHSVEALARYKKIQNDYLDLYQQYEKQFGISFKRESIPSDVALKVLNDNGGYGAPTYKEGILNYEQYKISASQENFVELLKMVESEIELITDGLNNNAEKINLLDNEIKQLNDKITATRIHSETIEIHKCIFDQQAAQNPDLSKLTRTCSTLLASAIYESLSTDWNNRLGLAVELLRGRDGKAIGYEFTPASDDAKLTKSSQPTTEIPQPTAPHAGAGADPENNPSEPVNEPSAPLGFPSSKIVPDSIHIGTAIQTTNAVELAEQKAALNKLAAELTTEKAKLITLKAELDAQAEMHKQVAVKQAVTAEEQRKTALQQAMTTAQQQQTAAALAEREKALQAQITSMMQFLGAMQMPTHTINTASAFMQHLQAPPTAHETVVDDPSHSTETAASL